MCHIFWDGVCADEEHFPREVLDVFFRLDDVLAVLDFCFVDTDHLTFFVVAGEEDGGGFVLVLGGDCNFTAGNRYVCNLRFDLRLLQNLMTARTANCRFI